MEKAEIMNDEAVVDNKCNEQQKHNPKSHTVEKPYTCLHCNSSFPNASTLKRHIQKHHKKTEKRSRCKTSASNTRKKSFKCTLCGSAFAKGYHLKVHIRTHTGEKPFKCTDCEASFSREDHLNDHVRTHTAEKPFKCSLCTSSFARSFSLKLHIRMHTGEKPYKCSVCASAFSSSSALKRHTQKHTGEKSYKCKLCDSAFSLATALKRHIRTHTGEKPYECSLCDSAFYSAFELKTHVRKHTGEKPYKCSYCDSAFYQSSPLKYHLRTHTGEKPYKCSSCSATFTWLNSFKKHMQTHTGEKPDNCLLTDSSFSKSSVTCDPELPSLATDLSHIQGQAEEKFHHPSSLKGLTHLHSPFEVGIRKAHDVPVFIGPNSGEYENIKEEPIHNSVEMTEGTHMPLKIEEDEIEIKMEEDFEEELSCYYWTDILETNQTKNGHYKGTSDDATLGACLSPAVPATHQRSGAWVKSRAPRQSQQCWVCRHEGDATSAHTMASKSLHWRREDIMDLIGFYKENVCLWQVKHRLYKDRNARDAAMKIIYDSLKQQMPDVTSVDIKNKLHTLRSQYRRELRLMKDSSKSGAGAEDVYKPKLWCFDAFDFLTDGEEIRDSTSNLDFEVDESLNNSGRASPAPTLGSTPAAPISLGASVTVTPPLPSPPTQPDYVSQGHAETSTNDPTSAQPAASASGKRKKKIDNTDELIKVALAKLEAENDKDSFMDFGVVVGKKLTNMDKYQATIAEKIINDALFLGTLNKLSEDHHITNLQ